MVPFAILGALMFNQKEQKQVNHGFDVEFQVGFDEEFKDKANFADHDPINAFFLGKFGHHFNDIFQFGFEGFGSVDYRYSEDLQGASHFFGVFKLEVGVWGVNYEVVPWIWSLSFSSLFNSLMQYLK